MDFFCDDKKLTAMRPTGSIFCSTEQSKLCFQALLGVIVPQNHLPLQGAENPSKVVVFS